MNWNIEETRAGVTSERRADSGAPTCASGEHVWRAVYCDVCGYYRGDTCECCHMWTDGSDNNRVDQAQWCWCDAMRVVE